MSYLWIVAYVLASTILLLSWFAVEWYQGIPEGPEDE